MAEDLFRSADGGRTNKADGDLPIARPQSAGRLDSPSDRKLASERFHAAGSGDVAQNIAGTREPPGPLHIRGDCRQAMATTATATIMCRTENCGRTLTLRHEARERRIISKCETFH